MNLLIRSFVLVALAASLSQAALRIVATVPDLADITRQIGGEHVKVDSIAKGTEDIHAVPQKPSFVPKLNRADGVVLIGLDMEHAFLPALLAVAQNSSIQPGAKGYIDCSEGIHPVNVPTDLSRAHGELHPHGNPHYNTDPRHGAAIAESIAKGLSRLDPVHADVFEKNKAAFVLQLQSKIAEWNTLAAPLKGKKAVSHHEDIAYFADFLGLEMRGTVEVKPGIPPTARHLEELAVMMKKEQVPIILREVQYPENTARWLAGQTGAKVATIAVMGGAFPDSQSYTGFIEHNIRAILAAAQGL
jgi:zinc/manganese transport system substrate-binding protein